MKIEIDRDRPGYYKEIWPGTWDKFSHYEFVANIPQALFLITTLKENGKANACFHSWSAFSGDPGGFFAVLTGLSQQSHTYGNIMRDKEFCVNFLSADYYDACMKTIELNCTDNDELEAAELIAEPSSIVKPPRVKEAFLSLECRLHSSTDLSGKGRIAMVIGEVVNAAVMRGHSDYAEPFGGEGFMYYIGAALNPETGDHLEIAHVAELTPVRPA